MKPTDNNGGTSRRTVLRGIGAAGLTVGVGAGISAAKPDKAKGRGAATRNRPGHKDFACPDGMEHLGTIEFVVEEDDEGNVIDCYFEQTEGEPGVVTITGFDSKPDEACEPVTVYYESATHTVGQVSAFGGMDTHVDDEPMGGVYESDLENPGGQQAAISLLHFCGSEIVIEEPDTNTTTTL